MDSGEKIEFQKRNLIPEKPAMAPEEVMMWQEQLVRGGLRAMLILGLIAMTAGSYHAHESGSSWVIPFYIAAYAGLLVLTLAPGISYKIQAVALVSLFYLLGIVDLIESGRGGDGRVYLLAIPLLAVLFFGHLGGFIALGVNVLTMAVFAWLFTSERIVIPFSRQANFADPSAWLSNTIVLSMLGAFLVFSLNFLVPRLIASLSRSRRLLQRLDEAHRELGEHSEELARSHRLLSERARAMEVINALAREAASIHDLQEVLDRVVEIISEGFNFYHTGIFLTDRSGEWAELRAVSSRAGKQLLAQGYRLPVDGSSIVGRVTGEGKPRVALDVDKQSLYLNDLGSPNTRSELTVPLRVHSQVIGALDVQSTDPEALSDDDVSMLQAIGDQLATVISNVRLYNQVQASLDAERRAYRELSRDAWHEAVRSHPYVSYRYRRGMVNRTVGDRESDFPQDEAKENELILELPLRIRGQVIGTLVATKPFDAGKWSREQTELLNVLAEQLGAALESARLYRDSQQRALRERLVTDITTKIQASNDPETILQTAIHELRQTLQSDHIDIRFRPPEPNNEKSSNGSNRAIGA